MDVSAYLELKPAPQVLFDALPTHASRVRFMLPEADGDWRSVTWGAFARQTRELALFLASAELQTGEKVAVFGQNSVAWLASALAAQAAGGVMVPLYAGSTAEQAGYIVEHAEPRVVFADVQGLKRIFSCWRSYGNVKRIVLLDENADAGAVLAALLKSESTGSGKQFPTAAEAQARVWGLGRAQETGRQFDRDRPAHFDRMLNAVTLDQPGLMLYTSGTSGHPKGVPLSHRNVAANGSDWIRSNAPLLDEKSVDLLWLPMSHIFGFGEALLGNTLGFTSYLVDPSSVLARMPSVRPNIFMSVPSVWEKLYLLATAQGTKDPRQALNQVTGGNLKFCLSGGAGLKREVKEYFHANGLLLIEGYGLTECAPTLTLNQANAFRFDSVGKPLASVQLKLAEDGEILAKGPNVFSGYHKDSAATAAAFTEDGWFKTGDIGKITEDGFLQIIDRKKDILVTAGGKNVPPQNIELRFRDDPLFAHVVLFGDGQKYLVAGVWLNEEVAKTHLSRQGLDPAMYPQGCRALVEDRIEKINSQLASFERIKRFSLMERPLTVANEMLTSTLKIRRKKIYEAFRSELEGLYA